MQKHTANRSNQLRWGLATCAVCFVWVFIYKQIEIFKASQTPVSTAAHRESSSAAYDLSASTTSMVSVTLPSVPEDSKSLNRHRDTPATTSESENVEGKSQPSLNAAENQSVQKSTQAPVNHGQLMDDLKRANMRITLPSGQQEKRALFQYLYQCVGIGLGAIETVNGDTRLMPLMSFPERPSKLLRTISGPLSQKEFSMQQVYARGKNLVRVYPAHFDYALTSRLNAFLQGEVLTSFTARYVMHDAKLYLENITINEQRVGESWQMFDGTAVNCRLYYGL